MSDPIDKLTGLGNALEDSPMPLPASEIRARGDRIRRRNHALLAGASAFVLAAVAVPVIALTTGGSERGDDIAPQPTITDPNRPPATPTESPTPDRGGDAPTEIPSTFPLASGWPDDDGSAEYQLDGPSRDLQAMIPAGELQACGNTAVERDAVDRLTSRLTIAEGNSIREIQLFFDEQEAVTYVAHLRNLYQSCPTEDSGGAPPTFTTTVGEGAIGEESLDIRRASDGIGQQSIFVIRIGNAVTVSSESNEGPGAEVDGTATAHRENLADVVAAMTELQGRGSTGDPGEGGTASPVLSDEHLIGPDDLPAVPADAGWQQVPAKSTPTLVCQEAWLSTLGADEVLTREFEVPAGGGATYPADMANVAVLQFADTETASGAYETVLGWLRDCPAAQTDYEPRIDTPVTPIEVATDPDVAPVDRAHQVRTTYGAPEVCPDGCDAAWFDHQAAAQTGDRLVLVTYAELAGPCPPGDGCGESEESLRPWLDRVAAAVDATVSQASWDRD